MKKFFKFLGILLVVIIALLIIIPYFFSDKIEAYVKEEIQNYVDAKVDYDDFSLSIFSSFPDIRAGIDGLSVVGKNRFDGDTLAYIGKLKIDVDIMSVFSEEYAVNAVIIETLKANGIVTSDSIANWDIAISSDTITTEEVSDTAQSTPLKLKLEKVVISNAYLSYIDSTSNMAAYIGGLNLDSKIGLDGDIADVKFALDIAGIDFATGGLNLLKKATIDFDANINADLANSKFTFKENTLNFSGVPLAFDGYAQLKDSTTTIVDMQLAAKETQFKTLLALVPDYIMKDVAGLQADGSLELYAKINGEYIDMEHIPALDVAFKVNNGKIKYPDLPKSLNDINVDVTVKNPSGSADLTTINVNKFHFELGSNPFDASLNLVTPISNATFNAGLNGTIDLNSLKEALPLDSMTIGGIVNANVNVATNMKAIEAEKYEDINAQGSVALTNFTFTSNDLPQGVNISEAKLAFSPKQLDLNPLNVTLGKSDFAITGKIEQYLSYVLSDGTLKGVATLKSNTIDCNELMGESAITTETATTETLPDTTSSVGIVEIPKNIDFTFTPTIGKLYFDNLVINDINGKVTVKDGIASLSNLKMALCQGNIALNGKYNTQNIKKPSIDIKINLNNVDINDLTNSFSTIDSLIPIAKSAHGKVTIGLDIDSKLDQEMSPILKTLNGSGDFASQDIQLKGSEFQNKLTKLLNNDKYSELSLKNCSFDFTIVNGSIVVNPFNFKMLNKQTTFSGKQGLDKTMDYLMSIPVTRAEAIKLLGSKLGDKVDAEGADIPVGIAIGGTLTSPKLSLNLDDAKKLIGNAVKDAVKEKVDEVKEKAKEKVEEKVEEVKEEVKTKVEEKVSEELKNNEQLQEAKDKAKNSLKNLFKK